VIGEIREALGVGGKPMLEELPRVVRQRCNSLKFYKERIEEIEGIKNEIPEPVKTKIINILANGKPQL
jgi:hypothetical protein